MPETTLPVRPGNVSLLNLPGSLSPGALDLVKCLALVAMLGDHINTLFLAAPRPELYALGRMAFPLFAMIWAVNVHRPGATLQQRATRSWLWALATQPVFSLAFHGHMPGYALNILFVFAGVTQLLALQHRYGRNGAIAGTLLLACLVWPLTPASYGIQGLVLVLVTGLYWQPGLAHRRPLTGLLMAIALVTLNGMSLLVRWLGATLVMAVLPTILLPFCALTAAESLARFCPSRFMPRHFFWLAYAGHLLVLGLVRLAL